MNFKNAGQFAFIQNSPKKAFKTQQFIHITLEVYAVKSLTGDGPRM